MKLAFMSSVLPKATLGELLAEGKKQGYEGIEFRPEWSHAHGVELSATAAQRKPIRRQLAEGGLEPCCISPSVKFNEDTPGTRDAQLESMRRYIELAADVGIGRIRCFADPLPNTGGGLRTANLQAQSEYLARGAAEAKQAGVTLVLETHGTARGVDIAEILWRAAYPSALRINWHLGHCLNHGEDLDEAYRHVKGRVDHVHFSLGEDKHEAIGYMIRQAQLLADEKFQGFFSVEVINPPDGLATLKAHAEGWKIILEKASGVA